MKILEKRKLKGIKGGVQQDCSSSWFTTTCTYSNGDTYCAGTYNWFGGVKSLKCVEVN